MREFKIQLGKVLIAFSIVILFLGFSLSIDTNKYQSNIIVSGTDNELPDTTIEVNNPNNVPQNTGGNTGTSGNAGTSGSSTTVVTPPSGGTTVTPSTTVDDSITTYNNDQLTVDGLTFDDGFFIKNYVDSKNLKNNDSPKALTLNNKGMMSTYRLIAIITVLSMIIGLLVYFE